MLEKIPQALIIFRFLLGPVILLAYFLESHPYWYVLILTLAFGSDFFDGVIARKLKVSTDRLRSLDSWADTTFYVCVFIVAVALHYAVIVEYWIALTLLLVLEITRHVFDHVKFGRSASYHMWSAKLWGVCLYLAFVQLLGWGETDYLFLLAIVVGILTDIEGLLASKILSSWRADIPSIFHAYKIEKENI